MKMKMTIIYTIVALLVLSEISAVSVVRRKRSHLRSKSRSELRVQAEVRAMAATSATDYSGVTGDLWDTFFNSGYDNDKDSSWQYISGYDLQYPALDYNKKGMAFFSGGSKSLSTDTNMSNLFKLMVKIANPGKDKNGAALPGSKGVGGSGYYLPYRNLQNFKSFAPTFGDNYFTVDIAGGKTVKIYCKWWSQGEIDKFITLLSLNASKRRTFLKTKLSNMQSYATDYFDNKQKAADSSLSYEDKKKKVDAEQARINDLKVQLKTKEDSYSAAVTTTENELNKLNQIDAQKKELQANYDALNASISTNENAVNTLTTNKSSASSSASSYTGIADEAMRNFKATMEKIVAHDETLRALADAMVSDLNAKKSIDYKMNGVLPNHSG